MKTKNIFKTLAFAMLMPAMLLIASCSSDIINDEVTVKESYTIPVTINVTRQGDDPATKATFDGSKLNFSEGDKLFVSGSAVAAGSFAGTLTWTSGGTFSGTITTENTYTGTADALFTAGGLSTIATLLPNGYESYGYLSIDVKNGYDDVLKETALNSFATSKKLAVEQLSFEVGAYTSGTGFALSPLNSILNFTVTGFAPSTTVTATLKDNNTLKISGDVTTDAEGKATFAMGVFATRDLNELTLTVAGNPITLVTESKTLTAGKIYNITRAVTPPTLAQTMTTAGMTVKVKYNYEDEVNYCLFSSVGDGTYTFQSGDGWAGGDAGCAKALVVENGKLVFKQNFYDTIDDQWSNYGFSATFDTSNNSYVQFVGPSTQQYHNPSFISVEVNSVPIALTKIITVSDLVKEQGQYWSEIIANNSDKIKEDGGYVVRKSDNAKLQWDMLGMWQDVMTNDHYQSGDTYKFEGD